MIFRFLRSNLPKLDRYERLLLSVLVLLIVCSIAGLFISLVSPDTGIAIAISTESFAEFVSLGLLVTMGTTRETIYWRVITFGIGVVIISMVFIILHLPAGRELLVSGYAIAGAAYIVRFITKSSKKTLDWLKVIWITSWIGLALMKNFVVFDGITTVSDLAPTILCWITVGIYIIQRFRQPAAKAPSASAT